METQDKKAVVERLLAGGDAMICVDSRRPDVKIPEEHRGNPDLRLILNLGFRGAIRIRPDGIEAELLFQGVPFSCWLPFESIWGMYDAVSGEGFVWPGEVPEAVRDFLDRASQGQGETGGHDDTSPGSSAGGDSSQSQAAKPRLQLIRGGKKEETGAGSSDDG